MTEPIAIVGMSCKFPGGVESPDAFWRFLIEGRDGISDIPSDRWDSDCYATNDVNEPGKIYARRGGFVTGLDLFDPGFFGISSREASRIDPQQRWLLEKTYEAFDDAGIRVEDLRGSNTGVYIGQFMRDWEQLQSSALNRELVTAHTAAGGSMAITANRISYAFDLMGPSLALDTACSSALVAMHIACTALTAGQIDAAIVGACNILLRPEATMAIEKGGLLSADGRCKSFDASADGYVRSEGAGVFILKPLARAQADGDRIRALIRATASNQDGRTSGISVPNGEAQAQLFARALELAGLRPDQIQYAEAHGTGTAVGDPIETNALGRVLRANRPPDRPCVIGSVKSNLGHAEACAAITGLMKTVLAMEHGTIPANLHLETLNPRIDLDGLGLSIAREPTPWPDQLGEPRRAIVNSFGFGGSNATIIVEAPGSVDAATDASPAVHSRQRVLTLSARSGAALDELAARYARLLADNDGPSLDDICYTAACRRSRHPHRLAAVGSSRAQLAGLLEAVANGQAKTTVARGLVSPGVAAPRLCFVLSGNGPQWPRMGAELYACEPVFRAAIERCDAAFRAVANISIRELLYVAPADDRIHKTRIAQLGIFSIQVALAELLKSWGIVPDIVVGHSIGEAAAAHIAGALSFEHASAVVHHRSRLHSTLAGTGRMLAVGLSAEEAHELIAPFAGAVSLAAVNGPSFVALAGDEATLTKLEQELSERDVFCRMLQTEVPYHSPVMDSILTPLTESLAGLAPRPPERPLYSTVHSGRSREGDWSPAYWAENSRRPVEFMRAIESILADADGPVVFVELSPHPVLGASIVQTAGQRGVAPTVIPTLRRGQSGPEVLAHTLAQLFVAGIEVPWSKLVRGRLIDLPSYPWQHRSYWSESDAAREVRLGYSESVTALGGTRHPLLGRRLNTTAALWQAQLGRGQQLDFLQDHAVSGDPVYPAAAYIEAAVAAARSQHRYATTELEALEFRHILLLDGNARDIELALAPDQRSYRISSRAHHDPEAEWTIHATGRIVASPRPAPVAIVDLDELRASLPRSTTTQALYDFCHHLGLEYAERFRNVEQLWRRAGATLARVVLPESISTTDYALHPASLDACFHALLAALMPLEDESPLSGTVLPISLARISVYGDLPRQVWSYCTLVIDEPNRKVGDLWLYADDGRLLVEITGLEVTVLTAKRPELSPEQAFYSHDWLEAETETEVVEPRGRWLIYTDSHGYGRDLDARLRAHGVTTFIVEPGPQAQLGPDDERLRVRPHEVTDFTELMRTTGGDFDAIVHLGALDAELGASLSLDVLEQANAAAAYSLLHLVQAFVASGWTRPPRLFVCTKAAIEIDDQPIERAAEQAVTWGLGRVILAEYPLVRTRLIDLDLAATDSEQLFAELRRADPEEEIALRGHRRLRARMQRRDFVDDRATRIASDVPVRAMALPDATIDLEATSRIQPGPGAVEIEVNAAEASNWPNLGALGLGCCGVITAIGPDVEGLVVGQRVVAAALGSLRSHLTIDARQVVPAPTQLDDAMSAALVATAAPARLVVEHVAHIRPGERVLVHVDGERTRALAVQALALGAEVLSVSRSEALRLSLRDAGVPSWAPDQPDLITTLLDHTDGRGVDVELGASTSDAPLGSGRALARWGRLILLHEGGDAPPPLELDRAARGVSTITLELGQLVADRGHLLGGTLDRIVASASVAAKPVVVAADDLRQLQADEHGVRIVELRSRSASVRVPEHWPVLPTHKTCMIAGGLGGIGLEVMEWAARQGVRTIVLTGRRRPSPESQARIDAVAAATGARIEVMLGDISEPTEVRLLFERMDAELPPLGGVIHSAGVEDDGIIELQDVARFRRVYAAKITGTWLLHQHTRERELEYFVMFSSMGALFGWPGQSAYASGNAFMDGLSRARRAQGLPAVSIGWGPWGETGMVAKLSQRSQQRMWSSGFIGLSNEIALRQLNWILRTNPTEIGVFIVDWPKVTLKQRLGPAFENFVEVSSPDAVRAPDAAELAKLPVDERRTRVEQLVLSAVAQVLGDVRLEADRLEQTLFDLGFDSLMVVELRDRLQAALGLPMPATLAFKYPTVRALLEYVLSELAQPMPAGLS